jgi:hypothetical protein
MGREYLLGKMASNTLETSIIIIDKVMELSYGLMEEDMMESGIMNYNMEKEVSSFLME